MDDEVWEVIEEAPRYSVSNYGRVFNNESGRLMSVGGSIYNGVQLYIGNGNYLTRSIHVLVLEAFMCPRPPGYVVNHKDLNTKNNHVSNLEWVTNSENVRHGRQNGKNYTGGSSKVRVRVVESGEEFDSIRDCANFLGIHEQSITNCLNGRSKTGGGYRFERI